MNSIFAYSQACRDKGSPFRGCSLSVTYQYVLIETFLDAGLEIKEITSLQKRNSFQIVVKNLRIFVDGDKHDSAYKVLKHVQETLKHHRK